MSGDHVPVLSLENARDLEAAMGLVQELTSSQALTAAVLESRLGWPEGKIEAWLAKPYEARLVDYLRLLRQAAASILEQREIGEEGHQAQPDEDSQRAEPDILESIFQAGAHRDGGAPKKAPILPDADPDDAPPEPIPPLRLMDLHLTTILARVESGSLDANEVIKTLGSYEEQIRKAGGL